MNKAKKSAKERVEEFMIRAGFILIEEKWLYKIIGPIFLAFLLYNMWF